ncbi:PfkB family carbohydrate kinase [Rhodobacter sp. Har01]|uniref:PfkB family carbohydrate kinase n=1 Tax=Rhodobacter sp. Har01 TaxID=2883999 RepID=UPI001D0834FC|nr:PfkB family carbohydrate kinase [Rhodobacter sp. Har01]MCB6176720.1 PfkB family carbohydrate kinase [Rhodobacter sp. Har01]
MTRSRLIQLSGVIVDLLYRVEAVPAPGTEAQVRGGCRMTAGGGFNAMVAARRFGVRVGYAGSLGTGPLADVVSAALAAEGIDILRPRLAGQDQGCCTVLVDDSGERTFIAAEGADGQIAEADLAALTPAPEDWFLLSGYALSYAGSQEALTAWLEARPQGLPLLFDPCPQVAAIPTRALAAALRCARWISANAAEAEALTGRSDPTTAARALAATRPAGGGALVRVGAEGCHLARPDGSVTCLPGHPVRAIDTNGAGDAHVGAFLALLAQGAPPLRAAALANVAAALSTTQEGPATAPDLKTVLAALAEAPAARTPSPRTPSPRPQSH